MHHKCTDRLKQATPHLDLQEGSPAFYHNTFHEQEPKCTAATTLSLLAYMIVEALHRSYLTVVFATFMLHKTLCSSQHPCALPPTMLGSKYDPPAGLSTVLANAISEINFQGHVQAVNEGYLVRSPIQTTTVLHAST